MDLSTTEETSEFGDFQEVVLLNGLHVLQHNPHLLRLVEQSEPVTLPQLRKALGKGGVDLKPLEDEFLRLMGNVAEEEGMGTIFRSLLLRSETDTESAYEAKKMISEMYGYFRNLLMDLPTVIGKVYRLLPELTEKGAPFLQKHNAFVRWVYNMPPSDYREAIRWLWESDLLHPMILNLVCRKCKDAEGQPLSLVLSSDVSPKDLESKTRCIRCRARLAVRGFYGLDAWIQRCIHSQDRLLAYAVGYSLDTSKKQWVSRVQSPLSEHDFHVTTASGTHLIECKVFGCSSPIKRDLGLRRKARDGISQLIKHMLEMQVLSGILICHPCPWPRRVTDEWIAAEVKRRNLPELAGKVRVAGIDGLPRILAKIA